MALGNISFFDNGTFGYPGDIEFTVAAGTTASINAGEPVAKAIGGVAVTAAADATPVVATDFYAGISSSTSTETAGAAGKVYVLKMLPGITYLCAPTTAAAWDTQAEYDALTGKNVRFTLAGGVYSVNEGVNTTYGLIVEKLDIKKVPGKVRFSIRAAVSYAA